MTAALITTKELKKYIDEGIDDKIIFTSLMRVQDITLVNIIGQTLYEKLQLVVSDGTINTEELKDYRYLIQYKIQPYLIMLVMSKMQLSNTFKIRNKGVVTNTDPTSGVNTVTMNDAIKMQNDYDVDAGEYGKDLSNYLHLNYKLFPEYSPCSCDPYVKKPSDNVYQNPFAFDDCIDPYFSNIDNYYHKKTDMR